MKRFLAMLLCLVTACLFVGCIPIPSKKDVETEVEDITAIEIYYFEKEAYWDSETNSWMYSFWDQSLEKYVVTPVEDGLVAHIEAEKYAAFVEDIEDLPFRKWIPLLPIPTTPAFYFYGYVIKIYSGTNYELITDGCGEDVGDILAHTCKEEDWNAFIKKYIGEELFMQIEQATQSSGDLV